MMHAHEKSEGMRTSKEHKGQRSRNPGKGPPTAASSVAPDRANRRGHRLLQVANYVE
jgi:hypothetical protein